MGTLLVKVGRVDVEIIDDDRVAHAVRRNGQFEPESLAAWADMCDGGKAGLVIDVGSYGGLFGIAAKLMKNEVIAIEPKPTMVRRTRANAALSGVKYAVLSLAASDRNGVADLGFDPANALTSASSLERKGPARMEVETKRLDDILTMTALAKIGHQVGAIKIDVEGHEAAVIRGALAIIERDRPALIVETLDDEKRKAEVQALLPGYHVAAWMDRRNLLMMPD